MGILDPYIEKFRETVLAWKEQEIKRLGPSWLMWLSLKTKSRWIASWLGITQVDRWDDGKLICEIRQRGKVKAKAIFSVVVGN